MTDATKLGSVYDPGPGLQCDVLYAVLLHESERQASGHYAWVRCPEGAIGQFHPKAMDGERHLVRCCRAHWKALNP